MGIPKAGSLYNIYKQSSEARNYTIPFSKQLPQDRPGIKFHLLVSRLCDKCVSLAEPLRFLNMIDDGKMHIYLHDLLLVFVVFKAIIVS